MGFLKENESVSQIQHMSGLSDNHRLCHGISNLAFYLNMPFSFINGPQTQEEVWEHVTFTDPAVLSGAKVYFDQNV